MKLRNGLIGGENKMTAKTYKREDKRKNNEMRSPIVAKVGIVPAVYGPKKMHPQHSQNPEKGTLRCTYNMLSFSVSDRIRPGPNRRSTEISKITQWALDPVVMLDRYPNMVVDVYIHIAKADAGTRCAGINAAAMALAHAGIPMKDMVSSVAVGKMDKTIVLDLDKYEDSEFEEGEGSTDIPMSFTRSGEITHLQLDGKISKDQLKEAIEMARKACEEIYEVQKKALKDSVEGLK